MELAAAHARELALAVAPVELASCSCSCGSGLRETRADIRGDELTQRALHGSIRRGIPPPSPNPPALDPIKLGCGCNRTFV